MFCFFLWLIVSITLIADSRSIHHPAKNKMIGVWATLLAAWGIEMFLEISILVILCSSQ